MDQKDRDMLIRMDENVIHIKAAIPKIIKKVELHEKLFLAIAISIVFGLSRIKGGWEMIRAFFQ